MSTKSNQKLQLGQDTKSAVWKKNRT